MRILGGSAPAKIGERHTFAVRSTHERSLVLFGPTLDVLALVARGCRLLIDVSPRTSSSDRLFPSMPGAVGGSVATIGCSGSRAGC